MVTERKNRLCMRDEFDVLVGNAVRIYDTECVKVGCT